MPYLDNGKNHKNNHNFFVLKLTEGAPSLHCKQNDDLQFLKGNITKDLYTFLEIFLEDKSWYFIIEETNYSYRLEYLPLEPQPWRNIKSFRLVSKFTEIANVLESGIKAKMHS